MGGPERPYSVKRISPASLRSGLPPSKRVAVPSNLMPARGLMGAVSVLSWTIEGSSGPVL